MRIGPPIHRRATTLAALIGGLLLFTYTPAYATTPAQGLSAAQERAADRVLDAARDRGVGELPASPFLRPTQCGRADQVVRNRSARLRAAMRRYAADRRAGRDVSASRRVLLANARLLRIARVARSRVCSPVASRTLRDEDLGALSGTTTTERPLSTVSGTGRMLVIPVDFQDVAARRATDTPARYEQLLFGENYPWGGGSLRRYWRDMSYGAYDVDGDVLAWRRMPGTRASYAGDRGGMGTYPANSQRLLEDAIRSAVEDVDLRDYDGNRDGVVDSVMLVVAGTPAAQSGDLDSLWPHAWRRAFSTSDGVKVDRYMVVPERMASGGVDGDLLTVGVAAHEYGHVLGLPDLLDGEDGAGAGSWDLMGTGVWGFRSSARPTGLSAWSRARLGWTTPQLLEGDNLAYPLGSSYVQRTAVKLPIANASLSEHFLVERRTRTGFDADLPGDGLLVWHVDDSIDANDVSGNPRVELVAADGSGNSDAGDLLTAGQALSDSSSPSTKAHDGGDSKVAIQNVEATTVDLHAGAASLAPVIDTAIDEAGPQAAAPTVTFDGPVTGTRVRGTITMTCTGTGSPNVNRVSFYRNSTVLLSNVAVTPSAPISTQTFSFDTTTVANGTNVLACRSRNTSNQLSAYATSTVTIDNTAPGTPSITAPAAAGWLRGTVSYTATGTDNYGVTRFSYRVDGIDNWQGPWAEATPQTQTYAWDTTLVANGAHALTVRAEDLAGNQSVLSATRTVNVDNAAPTVTTPRDGSVAPDIASQVSTTTLNANWTAGTDTGGSGMSSYQWRFCTSVACSTVVASGSGAGLTASATGLSLANGTYFACVSPVDVAGNVGTEQCSNGVIVDTTAPSIGTPNDGSAAPDVDGQASTTTLNANWAAASDGSGVGGVTYDWRFCTTTACGTILASGSGAGVTASAGALALANASTYFACVRAKDSLNNTSAYVCSDGVTVDNAAPVVSVPTDGAVAPDRSFQQSSTSLDANWSAATDASGVASYDWRFCPTVACGTILASGSGAGLTASAGSLTLTNGSTYFACVRATDTLGNVSAYTCSNGIRVDNAAPTTGAPNDGTAAPDLDSQASTTKLDANWAAGSDGTGSGVATYDWRFCTTVACGTVLASGSTAGLTATATGLTLTAGPTYYACVRATDAVGNVGAYTCSDGIVVDDGPPVMSTPTDGTTPPDIDFQLSATALDAGWLAATDANGVASYDWRFCPTTACGTVLASGSGAGLAASATLALSDGSTYFACVRAVDTVGSTSAYSCSDGVTVDTAAPTLGAPNDGSSPPDIDAQTNATQLDANWAAASDGAGSGVASYDWRFCTSSACTTILASGSGTGTTATAGSLTLASASTYFACVRAVDALGTASAWTCSDGVTVDNAPPVMSTPTDGAALPDIDFQVSSSTLGAIWPAATDDVAVAGYDWRFCTSTACSTVLASGSGAGLTASAGALSLTNGATYFACVRASDSQGNQSAYSCSDGVAVDTAAPTMSTPNDGSSAPDIDTQSSSTQLRANWSVASDGVGSGVAGYDWRFCTSPACGTVLASGTGTGLTATASSLSLTTGVTYVACVRATDALGTASLYSCSDGVQVVDLPPTMSTPTDGSTTPDLDYQQSTTTLDAVWAAATDDNGVVGYDWRFCTSPSCGTIVASGSGAGTSASAGSLSLANGATYYACARATDTLPQSSAWACSDGIVVDTAGPTLATPNDGATAPDIDSQGATGTLSANWPAASDGGGSGVAGYDWRLCTTTACGTILASGTGAATSATASSLSLTIGASYYACVRASDVLGNASSWTCSDGVTITADTPPVMSTPTDGTALPDIDGQTNGTSLSAIWSAATDDGVVTGYDWRICATSTSCGTIIASGSTAGTSFTAGGLSLTNGARYFACVRATDTVPQSSSYVCSDGVVYDTTAPGAPTQSGVSGTVSGTVSFQSSSTDAGGIDRAEYRIDGTTAATASAGGATSFSDPGTPFNTATLLDGNHAWRTFTFDLAGNSTPAGSPTQFIVNNNPDTGAPSGAVTAPAASSTLPATNVALTVNVAAGDVIVKIEWLLDGTPIAGLANDLPPAGYASGARTKTWASTGGVSAGAHTISARLTDADGDVTTTSPVSVTK